MTIKQIMIGAGILFVGFSMGVSMDTQEVEVVREVEKIVEVEKNSDTWRELKEVDDKAYMIADEYIQLCSAGFYAVSNLDSGTLEAVVNQIPEKNKQIEQVAAERQELLQKLGY